MPDAQEAQCAAEDAVIALGWECHSVLDEQSGTITIFLEQDD